MKGQLLDGGYVETGMKIRNFCFHHNWLFSGVYFCRFISWIFLFTHVTYFLVFQCNDNMISTMFNDLINLKPNWGCCVWILMIYFLVLKIDTWTVVTAPQYIFPFWKCMIRLRICAQRSSCHIRCFGINMTSMWHDCIYIFFIYVMWFFTIPSILSLLALIFELLQVSITPVNQLRMYNFSRNITFTNTHDLVLYCHLIYLRWPQWKQSRTTDNDIIFFIPSIFDTTIIGITHKAIMKFYNRHLNWKFWN